MIDGHRRQGVIEQMGSADELDPTSSVLAFFACEMRRARLAAGIAQTQLAKDAYAAPSLLNKIEAAKRVPSLELAEHLDRAFKTDGYFVRLWPLVIKHAYPAWFRPFVELEASASVIRSFQNQVIPGLLQTEEYARAIFAGGRADNQEDLVTARMERQRILTRDVPPRLWVIVDEYVLRRTIGGPNVMRGQLDRLMQVAEIPRIVVQVIPTDTRVHPIHSTFTRLSFEEGADVLYVDGFFQGQLMADPEALNAAESAYALLMAVALPPDASVDLIAAVAKEIDS